MMRRGVFVGLAILSVAAGSTAIAQNVDAVKARQAMMKDYGKATKPLAGMLKGDVPFDLAAVKAALTTYADGAKKAPTLFPEDSKMGGDTEASPEIWTKKADFDARFAKFGTDAEAAMTAITDEASFKATMPKLLGDCGACHKAYRVKS